MVPGAWRNFCIALSNAASPEPCGSSLPGSAPGATPAITAFAAVWVSPEASRTPVALPPEVVISATSALVKILPPAATSIFSSARIMVSAPPLPSTMPKLWLAIDSRYGNTAPPEMSGAKSRCMPQAASVAFTCADSKFSSSQARGEASSRRAMSSAPPTPFLRQAFQAVPASERMLIGEPSSRNRCSASARKCRDQAAPGLGVGGRERRDARDGFLEIGADAEPASVGKGAGEAIGDRRELQPVRFQFICIFPVKGRAGEQAQDSSRRNRAGSRGA